MRPGIHRPDNPDFDVSSLTHSMDNLKVDGVCKPVPECSSILSMTNVNIFKICRIIKIYTYIYIYISIYFFIFYKIHIYNIFINIGYH